MGDALPVLSMYARRLIEGEHIASLVNINTAATEANCHTRDRLSVTENRQSSHHWHRTYT